MNIKLAENISRLRKSRGLTQEQLAQLLNVSVGAVSKWENGNNRPDIEVLPILADVLQVSIHALIGYEKSYKNLELQLKEMNELLLQEKYQQVEEMALDCLRRYPNDFRLNKILADAYYRQCFSAQMEHVNDKKERGIYFYERCIELYNPKQAENVTEESLYMQIATLCMWDQEQIGRAMEIIERYNHSGTYDNLLASCFLFAGKKEEAKRLILHHSVANQIFCYNDFTILADLFRQEREWEAAVKFMEAETDCYCIYMKETGSYADRAYAGQAYLIAKLYKKMGNHEKGMEWMEKAKLHAEKYMGNPSMEISSLKFCQGVKGRMIDNFGSTLELLGNTPLKTLYEELDA